MLSYNKKKTLPLFTRMENMYVKFGIESWCWVTYNPKTIIPLGVNLMLCQVPDIYYNINLSDYVRPSGRVRKVWYVLGYGEYHIGWKTQSEQQNYCQFLH